MKSRRRGKENENEKSIGCACVRVCVGVVKKESSEERKSMRKIKKESNQQKKNEQKIGMDVNGASAGKGSK